MAFGFGAFERRWRLPGKTPCPSEGLKSPAVNGMRFLPLALSFLIAASAWAGERAGPLASDGDSPGRGPSFQGLEEGSRRESPSLLGFNHLGVAYVREHLAIMKRDLGVRPVKLHLGLHARERGPDFRNYDEVVEAAVSLGLPFVLTMAYVPDAWVEKHGTTGWQRVWIERYLLESVRRYAGKPGLLGMEIWNEPSQLNWSERYKARDLFPNADAYLDFLRKCEEAVRQAGSGVKLIAASPVNLLEAEETNLRYALDLAERLPSGVGLGLHLYGTNLFRLITYGRRVRSALREGAEVFITEFGDGDRENHLFVYHWMRPLLEVLLQPKAIFWYRLIASNEEKDSRSHALLTYGENPYHPDETPLYKHLKEERRGLRTPAVRPDGN